MRTMNLELELLDYWHAGSGRGRGPVVDAEVVRTPAGLPRLPAKSLRGLAREGVQQAADARLVDADSVVALFGSHEGRAGTLAFDDATLGDDYEAWARAQGDRAIVESLFTHIASTKMDRETGQVDDQTLRTVEVAVPLTLTARVYFHEGAPADAEQTLAIGLRFVRGLGVSRRRGLGRVRVTPMKEAR